MAYRSTFAKFIVLLIVIGVLLPSFFAFALLDDIAEIGQCALRNKLKSFLSDVIGAVVKKIKMLIKGLICGAISTISMGLIKCGPDPVDDQGGATASLVAKETIQDIIARCIGRQALSRMNLGILDIAITSGRDGGTTWIQNWRNLQLDSQYRGEGVFRGMLASTQLCNYFGNDLKQSFGATQKVNLSPIRTRADDFDSFQVRAGCTLPDNFNFNAYKNDFSGNGGWEAWSRLMEPQNNPYGSLFMALDEANKQRAIEESADINQALSNEGFLGISGDNAKNSCLIPDAAGKCLAYRNIKTPGVVISNATVDAAIRSELNWLVSVDEINELLVDMFAVVVNRLKNLDTEDASVPSIELDADIGGPISSGFNRFDTCADGCMQTYCSSTDTGKEYDCSSVSPVAFDSCLASCIGVSFCGNNTCEVGENALTCPQDCPLTFPAPAPLPPSPPPPSQPPPLGGGIGNDPGAPATVGDLGSVVWGDTSEVAGWAITAGFSPVVTGGGTGIDLNYDKAGVWPPVPVPGITTGSDTLVGNPWIFVFRNGNWVASTWDWMLPNQINKDTSNLFAPGNALRGGLSDFSPQSGETYGFMMSCLARDSTRNCSERSDVVMITWP